jgi:hypothetical protein
MKQQFIIITVILIALATAMLFLAFAEQRQVVTGDDFWSVYFIHPLDATDNSFIIDNHGPERMFTYTTTTPEATHTDTITVPEDEWHHIVLPDQYNNISPIMIDIEDNESKKSIYKK